MKLAIIFPVLNQHELSRAVIKTAIDSLSNEHSYDVELLVLDNASDAPFETDDNVKIIRLDKNIGVYPTFWEALKYTDADVLAFFHSDLFIWEKDWDTRVVATFLNKQIGLMGFIGSDEIDSSGGRGLGTTSNFQGKDYFYTWILSEEEKKDKDKYPGLAGLKKWSGSPARIHGKVNGGYSNASVVDGCAMIFRRSVLEQIKQRPDFPIHHHYDRLLCCETLELGFEVAVLGIACDHISNQTVGNENSYHKTAEEWSIAHNLPKVLNKDGVTVNWDSTIYQESERQFLREYRDQKHFIPKKV